MSVLSWGECDIFHATSTAGAPSGEWEELPTPKEDTTQLVPTAGTAKEAKEEGGALVDYLAAKVTHELEFTLFVKKDEEPPFEDDDGVIAGEHAFRVEPQDKDAQAIQIDRSILRVEESYSSADGILMKYVARVLKPKTGKSVKKMKPSEDFPVGG